MGDKSTFNPGGRAVQDSSTVSRRGFLETSLCGAAFAGASALALDPAAAQTGGGKKKMSQASVRYQDGPKGKQKCEGCVNFRPPSSCQIVDGQISPNGWCREFKPKGGKGSS